MVKTFVWSLLIAFLLAGCAGKTKLVPQAYMPEPPEILMRAPKDLNTIKPEQKEEEPDEEVQ